MTKNLSKIILAFAIAVLLSAGTAMALPFGDGGAGLQGVLDDITTNPAGDSSVDVTTDYVKPSYSNLGWGVSGSGGSISTVIIELAGSAGGMGFGVYDYADSTNKVELLSDSQSAGDQAFFSLRADGSVWLGVTTGSDTGIDFADNRFGFYLDLGSGAYLYSDARLNTATLQPDSMLAYEGPGDTIQIPGVAEGEWSANQFVFAWENWVAESNNPDYNDFVVLAESVNPVPEPGALAALGFGFMGLFGFYRIRFRT